MVSAQIIRTLKILKTRLVLGDSNGFSDHHILLSAFLLAHSHWEENLKLLLKPHCKLINFRPRFLKKYLFQLDNILSGKYVTLTINTNESLVLWGYPEDAVTPFTYTIPQRKVITAIYTECSNLGAGVAE